MVTINSIKQAIRSHRFEIDERDGPEFGGADVIITRDPCESQVEWASVQPFVVDTTGYVPRRRLVVTRHAVEISWLLCQFRELYADVLDYMNKYQFYGEVAQAAEDYLEQHGDDGPVEPVLLNLVDVAEAVIASIVTDGR